MTWQETFIQIIWMGILMAAWNILEIGILIWIKFDIDHTKKEMDAFKKEGDKEKWLK